MDWYIKVFHLTLHQTACPAHAPSSRQDQEKLLFLGQGAPPPPPKPEEAIHRIMASDPQLDRFRHKQRCNSQTGNSPFLSLTITNRIGDEGQHWLGRCLTLCWVYRHTLVIQELDNWPGHAGTISKHMMSATTFFLLDPKLWQSARTSFPEPQSVTPSSLLICYRLIWM